MALQKLLYQPGSNLTWIESGSQSRTVVPACAEARLDFRLIPDQEPGKIVSAVRRHLRKKGYANVEVTPRAATKPAKTPVNARIVSVVVATAAIAYKKEPSVWPILNASGPMNVFTDYLRIPTVGTGMADAESRLHAPNENIKVSNLELGINHVALVITRF